MYYLQRINTLAVLETSIAGIKEKRPEDGWMDVGMDDAESSMRGELFYASRSD